MSGFLPSTIDTIGGGFSTQRKNMNIKKVLETTTQYWQYSLTYDSNQLQPTSTWNDEIVLDGFTSKTKIQKKTCLVLRWAVSVTLSTMYEPKFGHVIGMSQKLPQKLTPLGWKTCIYHLIWEKNAAAYRLAPYPTPLNMHGLEPKKSPNGQLRRNIFFQIPSLHDFCLKC